MCFIEERTQEVNKKPEAVALPIWMGMRLWGNQDLEEFMTQFSCYRQFVSYNVQDLRDVDIMQMHGKKYLGGVKNLFCSVKSILDEADTTVAIFYIINARVAESNWFPILKKLIARYSPNHPRYIIVVDSGFEKNMSRLYGETSKNNPYSLSEIRSHQLGAIYSFFDSDAPTAGMIRLMEMMNRIMGFDLPERKFPNYNARELRQLAWHVCRENFNNFQSRRGAIPKYKIGENGRPVFNVRSE